MEINDTLRVWGIEGAPISLKLMRSWHNPEFHYILVYLDGQFIEETNWLGAKYNETKCEEITRKWQRIAHVFTKDTFAEITELRKTVAKADKQLIELRYVVQCLEEALKEKQA